MKSDDLPLEKKDEKLEEEELHGHDPIETSIVRDPDPDPQPPPPTNR